jgi:hypothetical protein
MSALDLSDPLLDAPTLTKALLLVNTNEKASFCVIL